MDSKAKVFIKNLSYAFLAQGLSMGLSILMSLIIPKFIGVTEFGYWQLFIFYISYAGFFHLGLTDGIYLRMGGKSYQELNHSLLGTQMKCLLVFQTAAALAIMAASAVFMEDQSRVSVIWGFCIYMVTFNMVAYLGYIFQAVNRTKDYSTAIIIEKTLCFIGIMILIIMKVKSFVPYVMAYVICDVVAMAYCFYIGRKIVFSKVYGLRLTFSEILGNVRVGGKLLTANLSSLLIIGLNRVMIDNAWGIEAFGKFSLSLSLTNFFLLFISQVSMVLFPALRQSKEEHIQSFYVIVRKLLGILLPSIFLLYFPVQFILGLWLPQYAESLKYLALLLPICTFDGRMQLVCNTYFKVLRKENVLLAVNIAAMLISGGLGLIGTFVLHNIYFTIISIIVAIAFRNILSEIYLGKMMGGKVLKDIVLECVLVVVFMCSAWFLQSAAAFMIYLGVYAVYLLSKRGDIGELLSIAKKKIRK